MTIDEMLAFRGSASELGEYQELIEQRKKLYNKLAKCNDNITWEDDSLSVLADEVGSERYNKHLATKEKNERTKAKTLEKLMTVESRIMELI